jgi:hypothetical protein
MTAMRVDGLTPTGSCKGEEKCQTLQLYQMLPLEQENHRAVESF